jgi:hypothetical protein
VAERLQLAPARVRLLSPVRLWVYDPALLAPRCPRCPLVPHAPGLAWRVSYLEPGTGGAVDELLDARTGALLHTRVTAVTRDYRIYDANGEGPESCFIGNSQCDAEYDEAGVCHYEVGCPLAADCCNNICAWGHWRCASPDAEEDAMFEHTNDVYDFLHDVFGRDSYDGDDGILRMYVHAGSSWSNAMSRDCGAYQVHIFGDGYGELDIVAHEVGHSYHGSEASYDYEDQPGAVAEHIADAIGHFVGAWTGKDPTWVIGDTGSMGDRSMDDPPSTTNPDHMDGYLDLGEGKANDYGGVHYNSTILSKGLYLLTDGGTHHDIPVRGIGEDKARRLYRRAIEDHLPDDAGFVAFVDAVGGACAGLEDEGHLTLDDCCQVRNAFAAVGLGDADRDCDGLDDRVDSDADGDGVTDLHDNCRYAANPDQANSDSDWDGDACDDDADGDGLANADDNCALAPNVGQADQNADGQGDACDDSDTDGVMDEVDDCVSRRNLDQADFDSDGEGDACDPDDDGDGVADEDDDCPRFYELDQADLDGDGRGNPCDNCDAVPNPDQADLDEDGQGDACDDDLDGDGVANPDDDCPRQAHEETEFAVCPPNTSCRYGCPSAPVPPELRLRLEAEAILGVDPAVLQPMARFELEPCTILSCGPDELLPPRAGVSVSVVLDLPLGQWPQMQAPLVVHAAVMDEKGDRLAGGDAVFMTDGATVPGEVALQLDFEPSPALAWGQAHAGAARPAYQLVLATEVGDQLNAGLLMDGGLRVRTQMGALPSP